MAKPLKLPRWSATAPGVGLSNVVEPSEGKKDAGFVSGERPPNQFFDWLFELIYEWIAWVDAGAWTAVSLVLSGALTVVNIVATGSVTGASLHFTAAATILIPNSLAFESIPTHTKGVGGYVYGASANPVYWPLVGLEPGDHITQVLLDFQKNTSNAVTNTFDIVKQVGAVETSVSGAPGTDNSNAVGAIAYVINGDFVVAAGTLYYFKLIPGNGVAPAPDRSFDLSMARKRP